MEVERHSRKIPLSSARGWLALFRPPNFLTVPGDILAGFFLAAGVGVLLEVELLFLVLAGFFFYGAGLLLNDWADVEVDRLERPERPLPAGLVSRRAVIAVAASLLLLAIGICLWNGAEVLSIGIVLALAVGNYNLLTKSLPVIGPLNMGLCRGLNFLLGATLAAGVLLPELAWWGFLTLFCYITAVTHLARREMTGRYSVWERWLPAVVLVTAFFVYLPLSTLIHWPAQVAVALAFLLAVGGAARIAKILPNRLGLAPGSDAPPPIPTPGLIGRLIGLLLPLQCAFIAGSGDGVLPLVVAALVLGLWPLKRWVGHFFYSS